MNSCRRAAGLTSSRLLASIYGRPPMISRASDVRLPSDVDRDYTIIDLDGKVSKERIPGASMFCMSVKLLNIFYEILETVYMDPQHQIPDNSGSRDAELLGKSLKLNHQLDLIPLFLELTEQTEDLGSINMPVESGLNRN